MTSPTSFAIERKVFEEHREKWFRSNPGKYVAIQGDVVASGFFDTYAEALRAGLREFDVSRGFLVRQVRLAEQVYVVS
ncbi:MAG TPA: hypothetical protein VGR47_16380 [Terracidiphilus sp.]|nr:hypothetical protein [Terracidiphilus sp.]